MNWAKIDSDNVVLNVESATQEWVNEYEKGRKPEDPRYVDAVTDEPDKGAGIGFTYDESTGWFVPLPPDIPDCYFDRDVWEWIDPNPPAGEEGGESPTK